MDEHHCLPSGLDYGWTSLPAIWTGLWMNLTACHMDWTMDEHHCLPSGLDYGWTSLPAIWTGLWMNITACCVDWTMDGHHCLSCWLDYGWTSLPAVWTGLWVLHVKNHHVIRSDWMLKAAIACHVIWTGWTIDARMQSEWSMDAER